MAGRADSEAHAFRVCDSEARVNMFAVKPKHAS